MIFLSCLKQKEFDNDRWIQLRIPIKNSGLGLRFLKPFEKLFVTSTIASYSTLKTFLPNLNYLNDDDEFFDQFKTILKKIINYTNNKSNINHDNNTIK